MITVQYSTVQYSTVQYSTAQYSTVQYSQDFVLSLLDDALLCLGMCQMYVTMGGRDTSTTARYTVL